VLEKLSQTSLKDVPVLRQRWMNSSRCWTTTACLPVRSRASRPSSASTCRRTRSKAPAEAAVLGADLNGRELPAYNAPGFEANVPVLTQAAAGAGSFSVVTDPDGIVRSAYLIQQVGEDYYPSLSLATASLYLNALAVKPLMTETLTNCRRASSTAAASIT
jgi:adenylate cyclase